MWHVGSSGRSPLRLRVGSGKWIGAGDCGYKDKVLVAWTGRRVKLLEGEAAHHECGHPLGFTQDCDRTHP